ncbi:MAG: CvpA family protein [Dehalococcoidales bacterium]|nr:CvpA family protein [Dehalococcoidales bacterium]
MNWLDIAILVVLAISAVIGVMTGIIKIVLSIVGVIVGVVLAGRFSGPLGSMLTFIDNPQWAKIAAFVIILVAVLAVSAIIAVLLGKLASAVMLGWVNRLGGGVLGLIMGGVFCAAVIAMWAKFLGSDGVLGDSAVARFFLNTFPFVLGLLPAEFGSVRDFFR